MRAGRFEIYGIRASLGRHVPRTARHAASVWSKRTSEPVTAGDCFGHSVHASADDCNGDERMMRVRRDRRPTA